MIRNLLFRKGIQVTHTVEVLFKTEQLSLVRCDTFRHITTYFLGIPTKKKTILVKSERKVKYHAKNIQKEA